MIVGAVLEDARTFDGRRRFYAPGQHPATWRERELVKRLLAIYRIPKVIPGDDGHVELRESIAWHQRQIDDFERGQCLEKASYIEAMTPNPDAATVRLVERLREEAQPPVIF